MKKRISAFTSIILSACMLFGVLATPASALVTEQNVKDVGMDGYIGVSQYVQHEKDDIFKVQLTIQPNMTPQGGDFVFVIDASENMLTRKDEAGEQTFFEHALDATYEASKALLDPNTNPMDKEGAYKNRVWVVFYNGKAYDANAALLSTGNSAAAYCFISDEPLSDPTKRQFEGVPATNYYNLGTMKSLFNILKNGGYATTPIGTEAGIFNPTDTTVKAWQQRYTAVGLAAAYDVFTEFSGKGVALPSLETERKIVILLSNGPDYERDDAFDFAIGSEVIPQEGSMRMEALFMAKALKFQKHSYGSVDEQNLKDAATDVVTHAGDSYDTVAAGSQRVNSRSPLSLDMHKVTVGHSQLHKTNPPTPIRYIGSGGTPTTDPFDVNRGSLITGNKVIPSPGTGSDHSQINGLYHSFQYEMFGNTASGSTAGTPYLSVLNTGVTPYDDISLNRVPLSGWPYTQGTGGTISINNNENTVYTYDDGEFPLEDSYIRIAADGGMNAEIWSVGLFVGSNTAQTQGTTSSYVHYSYGNGYGFRDNPGAATTRWAQGDPYRSDFTLYSYATHTRPTPNTPHDAYPITGTFPGYDHENTEYPAWTWGHIPRWYSTGALGQTWNNQNNLTDGTTYISYIPKRDGSNATTAASGPHYSNNISGVTNTLYQYDTDNASWFTSMTWGTDIPSYSTLVSAGANSTQNEATIGDIAVPAPHVQNNTWPETAIAAPGGTGVLALANNQQVPRNGVNHATRQLLFSHLEGLSSVQTSAKTEGAGFDLTTAANRWQNDISYQSSKQSYLTTTRTRENNNITKATIVDTSPLNYSISLGPNQSSYGSNNFYVVTTVQEGTNSLNQDYQNYYEYLGFTNVLGGYNTALTQTLNTARWKAGNHVGPADWDEEDFEPNVRMIDGTNMFENVGLEKVNRLVRTFEDLAYEFYLIATEGDAYTILSEYFDVVTYGSNLKYAINFKTGMPLRYLTAGTTAANNGKKVTWNFNRSLYSGVQYYLVFYVKMSPTANDPDKHYPFQVDSYIDIPLRTMRLDHLQNRIRMHVIKMFPYSYVKANVSRTNVVILNEPDGGVMNTDSTIEVFPHDPTGVELLPNNLPLPYYTPSVTPAPKKLVDEKLDDKTVEKVLIPFGQ